jgi:UDP-glucose 4-epimerase
MNIGTGTGNSVMKVIKAVREVTGRDVPLDIVGRRAGDPPELVAVAEKIRRELGWEPEFPDIRSSVEHAYKWALKHPHGYDDK